MATATTDSRGNVSFSQVPSGSHPLFVSATGYDNNSSVINVSYDGQTFTVTLTGQIAPPPKLYTITVHVQDQQGTPVQGASVTIS